MYRAVEQAGVKHMVSWNLRRTPAIAHMRDLVRRGEIGDLYHFRARWASDWSLSPDYPLVWRMQAEHGGTGALGDLGSHLVDLSRYILDRELEQVIGMGDTFVRERPLLAAADRRGPVTVDDATVFMGRFVGGGLASFEVTRMAAGRRDEFSVEVNGSRGSLVFERTRPNELRFYSAADPEEVQGFRTIHTTGAAFPYAGAWWPRGLGIDYGESFVNQAYDLLGALARDEMPRPNFADGVQNQAVLDAVERSVASRQWIDLPAFTQRSD
jgi:predicted dehydrogenase